MSAIQAEIQVEDTVEGPCHHASLESLGSGGNATYRPCLGCEAVLVTFAGRVWLIPSAAEGRQGRADTPARRGGARYKYPAGGR